MQLELLLRPYCKQRTSSIFTPTQTAEFEEQYVQHRQYLLRQTTGLADFVNLRLPQQRIIFHHKGSNIPAILATTASSPAV